MARDPYRKKILSVESGIDVHKLAALLNAIEEIDLAGWNAVERRTYDRRTRPLVRVTSNGLSVFARNAWRQ